MTESMPALAYRDRAQDFSRAPLLMVLAILATVFGILGAVMNAASLFSMSSYLKNIPSAQAGPFVASLIAGLIGIPASLALAAAGVSFVVRSRLVSAILIAYVIISAIGAMTFLITMLMPQQGGLPFWSVGVAQAIPAIGRIVFFAIVFLLLRAEPVRMLINIASGAAQPLQPLLTE